MGCARTGRGFLVLVEAGEPPGPASLVLDVVQACPASLGILGALVREDVPVPPDLKGTAGRHGVRLPLNRVSGAVARRPDGDAMRAAALRICADGPATMRGMGPQAFAAQGAPRPEEADA